MSDVWVPRILIALGVPATAYGGWLLLSGSERVSALSWLIGGVVVHDAILVPLTLALVAIGSRVLAPRARRVATHVLVAVGGLTLVAVPVVGRWGAKADNPTLLDRPYAASLALLWLLALVAITVAVVADRTARPTQRPRGGIADGASSGGR